MGSPVCDLADQGKYRFRKGSSFLVQSHSETSFEKVADSRARYIQGMEKGFLEQVPKFSYLVDIQIPMRVFGMRDLDNGRAHFVLVPADINIDWNQPVIACGSIRDYFFFVDTLKSTID